MYCKKCGARITGKYCSECGTRHCSELEEFRKYSRRIKRKISNLVRDKYGSYYPYVADAAFDRIYDKATRGADIYHFTNLKEAYAMIDGATYKIMALMDSIMPIVASFGIPCGKL